MRCMNCGLPLSPERNLSNCPRCGASLNAMQGAQQQQQFEQMGWGNRGNAPQQTSWGQAASSGFYNAFPQQEQPGQMGSSPAFNRGMGSGFQQTPFPPRRPYPPAKSKGNQRLLFIVAGLCVLLGAMLLGLVAIIGLSGSHGNASPNTAQTSANTSTQHPAASPTTSDASASPTASDSPTTTGTAYPGQQYIDGAQMAMGVDKQTMQPQQPTTTFKAGSNMYVIFHLHPPSQGGAVCAYWYLNGNQVTSFASAVKGTSHASYTYAIYSNAGPAYVELYWASDKSCSDKMLAQHVDFTVTT